jgi:hypothetical protein
MNDYESFMFVHGAATVEYFYSRHQKAQVSEFAVSLNTYR